MRDPGVIENEMFELFQSAQAQKDPYGAEQFRDLFMEHLESLGYVIEQTECGLCGHVFDIRGLQEQWETRFEGGVFNIIYTCPHDSTQTPLKLRRPKGNAFLN